MSEQVQYVIQAYKQLPGDYAEQFVDVLQKAVKNNMLPTPFDYCVQMFWLTTSLGSVGGALTALIAGKLPLKSQEKNQIIEN